MGCDRILKPGGCQREEALQDECRQLHIRPDVGQTDSSDAFINKSTIEQVKIVQLERVEHPWMEDGKTPDAKLAEHRR